MQNQEFKNYTKQLKFLIKAQRFEDAADYLKQLQDQGIQLTIQLGKPKSFNETYDANEGWQSIDQIQEINQQKMFKQSHRRIVTHYSEKPTVDNKYGVHFEYYDLFNRLLEVQKQRSSVSPQPRQTIQTQIRYPQDNAEPQSQRIQRLYYGRSSLTDRRRDSTPRLPRVSENNRNGKQISPVQPKSQKKLINRRRLSQAIRHKVGNK